MDVAARAGWQPAELARAFLDGGARCVQVRGKTLPSNRFLDLCDTIVGAGGPYGAEVIVNDRADLALMAGAAGVHVGQDDMPPSSVRRVLGRAAVIGISTHTTGQIRQGCQQPVNYIAIGPVFGTRTKATGYEAVGLGQVSEARRWSRGVPVVAIGGITLETAPSVWRAGASSVAVIGDLLQGNDPVGRVRAYLEAAAAHAYNP